MKNQYTSTIKKDHFEIKVDLDRESHSVFIGSDLIHKVGELAISQLKNKKVFVVTEDRVGSLYLASVKNSFGSLGVRCESLCLEAGEPTKSWSETIKVVEWLNHLKIEVSVVE